MIKELHFPEYTNAQINAAMLCDKVNEIIRFLNERDIPVFAMDNQVTSGPGLVQLGRTLKEGVKVLKNGRFMLNGKLIKKDDAYA